MPSSPSLRCSQVFRLIGHILGTGTWEQRKLKNISLEIGTGKSRFIKFNKSEKYMYKILGSTSIIGYTNHFDYEGDFILTARVGANAGTIYRESGKVKISDNTVFIKASQINFLYYVLTNYNLKRLSFGTGQPLIKSSELNKLKLEVPTNELEQQELGVIFFTIDTLIAANEQVPKLVIKIVNNSLANSSFSN
ncbi:restriction endonuclease subunit S [Lactiplantibacillus plantarum]|uniref:restriction endonuclease subunit S n=1 Tax=Lactiplantibacillus plantarum TaxID=1590 RepID=UPI0007ABEBD8|nr:restriction endonuclease subunit S [Lactiplantibacillus plantarum]WOI05003.1 restriction endonuclease subunit S [Lactiplantibacillus plantarum]